MHRLLKASLLVGFIGAVVALPLVALLAMNAYRHATRMFFWTSPPLLFGLAAVSFFIVYVLLPPIRRRARIAGIIAGLTTFLTYVLCTVVAINVSTGGRPWPFTLFPILASLSVLGWVPLLGGFCAGRAVERSLAERCKHAIRHPYEQV
jgi:hypothetical protein